MGLEVVMSEIKEYANECVWKNKFECVKAPDSAIIAYLKTLMYEKDFELFMRYKEMLLKVFRETAKEELDWLNS